ncbi:alpha-galactosidase D [Silvibacterium acidisoli]|uniref:alpha-galactosidase D n=1 Tax=Acidobacteriaceae bacterium ZG23-2 TaxID=2883246 RepID=UPI00406D4133
MPPKTGVFRSWAMLISMALVSPIASHAQVNGVGQRPYLGWSTYSQQTIAPTQIFLTQASIIAQSDALRSSGLQEHGYNYINVDAGWTGNSDAYGRTLFDTTRFPDIVAMIQHIHANGQKFGMYLNPGVGTDQVAANKPILGTPYHLQDIIVQPATIANAFGGGDKIDFTKPGAQEYINSIVDLYASWGVDFIKLDAVTPGSYNDNTNIDNRPDVAAYSKAIAQSGRPIWLTISWALDQDYIADWQATSNARRIEGDVECEGDCPFLTEWNRIQVRFLDIPSWETAAGPSLGWNDLDSLEIGNDATDGITPQEQRTAFSLWAMANAPLYIGGDLTKMSATGKQILGNDEVIAVDQSGHPAQQVRAGFTPVWVSDLGNGQYYVALFNLNAAPARVTFPWNDLGFAATTRTRDLWSHSELGPSLIEYSTVLPGHGVRLLKVNGVLNVPPSKSTSYEAYQATLTGSAQVADCPLCSQGKKVGYIGIGPNNNVFFDDVKVDRDGTYRMEVDSATLGTRSYIIHVNGGPAITLNSSGGSGNIPSELTIPVQLKKGMNSIEFGNPISYPPDLDRIVISGNGLEPYPETQTYEAELATLNGTVSAGFNGNASGLAKAGNIGGGSANNVTFSDVEVKSPGTYNLEIDYLTQGQRSFFVTVNDQPAKEVDLNGYTFGTPTTTVIQVQLKTGKNQIIFDNPSSFAPDLDSITVAPVI